MFPPTRSFIPRLSKYASNCACLSYSQQRPLPTLEANTPSIDSSAPEIELPRPVGDQEAFPAPVDSDLSQRQKLPQAPYYKLVEFRTTSAKDGSRVTLLYDGAAFKHVIKKNPARARSRLIKYFRSYVDQNGLPTAKELEHRRKAEIGVQEKHGEEEARTAERSPDSPSKETAIKLVLNPRLRGKTPSAEILKSVNKPSVEHGRKSRSDTKNSTGTTVRYVRHTGHGEDMSNPESSGHTSKGSEAHTSSNTIAAGPPTMQVKRPSPRKLRAHSRRAFKTTLLRKIASQRKFKTTLLRKIACDTPTTILRVYSQDKQPLKSSVVQADTSQPSIPGHRDRQVPVKTQIGNSSNETTKTRRGRLRSVVRDNNIDLSKDPAAVTIEPQLLKAIPAAMPAGKVPALHYGLDRVLFNPGVHFLQDPRSRVYNFDPYLEKIIDPKHFDFDALDDFRSPSSDPKLSEIAQAEDAKYFTSTSAITSVLQQFHSLLSHWRTPDLSIMSSKFTKEATPTPDFAAHSRVGQSIFLKPVQGGFAIDKAEAKPSTGILSFLGQCLEKLFTVPKDEFELYRKTSAEDPPIATSNSYHYTKFGSLLVRSQLDAHDSRLQGAGIFDIKTRAALPVRMDRLETRLDLGTMYELKSLHGHMESYEREFYDMARTTMFKYLLQARLGRMDGIFVAYHNVKRLFGFQYLSISEMDEIMHGTADPTHGDAELAASSHLVVAAMDHAAKLFPDEPLRMTFESKKFGALPKMLVFVEPVTLEDIEMANEARRQVAAEYGKTLEEAPQSLDGMKVSETFADDAASLAAERENWLDPTVEASAAATNVGPNISEDTGVAIESMTGVQTIEMALKAQEAERKVPERLAAFSLQVQSRSDDRIMDKSSHFTVDKESKWQLSYRITVTENREEVNTEYLASQKRIANATMSMWTDERVQGFYKATFFEELMKASQRSGLWRQERDRSDEGKEVVLFKPRS